MLKGSRRYIVIGLVVILGVLAIKQLIGAMGDYSNYRKEKSYLSDSEYANKSMNELTHELNFYHDEKSKQGSAASFQNRLWSSVSDYAEQSGLRISRLPGTKTSKENGYTIETNVFQIEGDFKKALTLAYNIEQKDCLAKVSSLAFEKKEDLVTSKTMLFTTVYFQNIKSEL